MMKKILSFIFIIVALLGLGSCDLNIDSSGKIPENPIDEPIVQVGSILIAYFSATGTTRSIANKINQIITSDIFEIEASIPYTEADLNYYSGGRCDTEQADASARPEIKNKIEGIDSYDTIFLGYPIWHGQAPRIISTFLESYDLSKKTIIPFCTSHSSGVGSNDDNLRSIVSNANWIEGKRFSASASNEEVSSWINSLELVSSVSKFNLKNAKNGTAPTVTLNNGLKMPVLGLGTYSLTGNIAYNAVLSALAQGYRLIDITSTIKTAFGRIRKWLNDLGSMAFKSSVDDADINSVSASKVTGLSSVATSGSYNDLSNKPSITKEAIGLENVANVLQYSASNVPPYPVTSVNGKTGAVTIETGDFNSSGTYPNLTAGKATADTAGNVISTTYLKVRKLKGNDESITQFSLSDNATYIISSPTSASDTIIVQGCLTCANKYWVTFVLKKSNKWNYSCDSPILLWLRSVNGESNVSYGFISLEASLSGTTLYISGWKINQFDNKYSNSHKRAENCYFALDSVYEILNSDK